MNSVSINPHNIRFHLAEPQVRHITRTPCALIHPPPRRRHVKRRSWKLGLAAITPFHTAHHPFRGTSQLTVHSNQNINPAASPPLPHRTHHPLTTGGAFKSTHQSGSIKHRTHHPFTTDGAFKSTHQSGSTKHRTHHPFTGTSTDGPGNWGGGVMVPFQRNKSRHQYGLASVDRNDKATLTLTAPRCSIKSSAKDLSLRIVKLHYTHRAGGFFHPPSHCRSGAIHGPEAYSYTTTMS